MNKREFVDRLRSFLSGRIASAQVEENARYYEDYINTQIRLGETEESVLKSLGDPRLIARSIVAAESVRGDDSGESQAYEDGEDDAVRQGVIRRFFHLKSLPSWAWPVMTLGVMLFVLVALGLLLRMVLHILTWLWPLIAIAMIVIFLSNYFAIGFISLMYIQRGNGSYYSCN